MSRIAKLLVQIGLTAVMLFSFGAVAYDCGLDNDGDENLGVAIVLGTHSDSTTVREGRLSKRARVTLAARVSATNHPSSATRQQSSAPMLLLGSAQIQPPLRT